MRDIDFKFLIRRIFTKPYSILGIVIVTIAFLVFPRQAGVEKPDSYDPKGFIFGTSEYLFQEDTTILMSISSLKMDVKKANVIADVHYICRNSSGYSTSFFIFQVPYSVDNVKVVTGAWYPEFFGGNTTVITPFKGLSYIIIQIPKQNQTFDKLVYMRFNFTIDNAFRGIEGYWNYVSFWKCKYYTYEFQLTFSNNFHYSIDNLDLLRGMKLIDRQFFFKSKETRLNIERPDFPYMLTDFIPIPDEMGYWDNKTWFRWDVKSISSPRLKSCSVLIQIENNSEKVMFGNLGSATWFLFGLGIPIVFSSLYLIWQEPRITIEVDPEPGKKYQSTGNLRFYHLIAKNIGGTTAYECEARISIKQQDGKKLFNFTGKWSEPMILEPLGPIKAGGYQELWPQLMPLTKIKNLIPNKQEPFCLIIKDDNQKECYAWSAESYLHNHKNPDWELELGTYAVEIELIGGNAKAFSKFMIKNKGTSSSDITIKKID